MAQLLFAVFVALASSAAAVKCPSYADVANMSNPLVSGFQLSRFQGTWYETYSHNLPGLTTGCHCTRYNVSLREPGFNTTFECRKGSPAAAATKLKSDNQASSDPRYPGMLKEAWELPIGRTPATDYWVLDVAADARGNYEKALVYSCTSELLFKQEWIYLFAKAPLLLDADRDSWMTYLRAKGVDTSGVTKVPQDGCWGGSDRTVVV
mmetsp:Transcript_144179/g.447723  ORF Transcript_144179/g.447723 Transcript_144179/m.447723 type:complete len:208 (+) Transcript_144179:78-701(+)|eukprot:CAMPEP_0204589018 /NCGR_PEP_ID=MMETSP0661-20131031/48957_1 /ASSEMBLY_ACC=CAM_ASM_000606 /TAXON_ID=109239 /ORGANISM="Alexandrium margalefi, Strain AMGDE01CS-322" /LENGTH=207 /DNA_ID=CAMNT_0051598895 /DNA_START=69 /DNA_END=692 /DNA_ORIENTATION=-